MSKAELEQAVKDAQKVLDDATTKAQRTAAGKALGAAKKALADADKAKAEREAAEQEKPGIRTKANVKRGVYRCGKFHSFEGEDWPAGTFTEKELRVLDAEPKLDVSLAD